MNIALEDTKEFSGSKQTHSFGEVFIRGTNGKWKEKEDSGGLLTQFCTFLQFNDNARLLCDYNLIVRVIVRVIVHIIVRIIVAL